MVGGLDHIEKMNTGGYHYRLSRGTARASSEFLHDGGWNDDLSGHVAKAVPILARQGQGDERPGC